jgi:ribosomal protein L15
MELGLDWGRGRGQEAGGGGRDRKRGQGQEAGAGAGGGGKRMNVHVSNRIFRPDDVTKRQSGWLREILGPEGCPRTCF